MKYCTFALDELGFQYILVKAILRDLLISAPSIYILLNKFSTVNINRKNIKNRQYLVNIKAIGVVVMTQSAIIFPLPGSW